MDRRTKLIAGSILILVLSNGLGVGVAWIKDPELLNAGSIPKLIAFNAILVFAMVRSVRKIDSGGGAREV